MKGKIIILIVLIAIVGIAAYFLLKKKSEEEIGNISDSKYEGKYIWAEGYHETNNPDQDLRHTWLVKNGKKTPTP